MDAWGYISAVPAAVVLLAGVAYLVANRRRSPRASGLALAAVVWLLILHLFLALLGSEVLQVMVNSGGLPPGTVFAIYSAVFTFLKSVGIALLIVAVMADRRGPPAEDDE